MDKATYHMKMLITNFMLMSIVLKEKFPLLIEQIDCFRNDFHDPFHTSFDYIFTYLSKLQFFRKSGMDHFFKN